MSLRDTIERDLATIMEDQACGTGWPIKVTQPDGTVGRLVGQSDDIHQVVDPDTNMLVSGRFAGVVLRLSSLTREGLGIPKAIADTAGKPWLIQFEDITGRLRTFKVRESNPDLTVGVVALVLEAYVL